jgi:hypothetical protein
MNINFTSRPLHSIVLCFLTVIERGVVRFTLSAVSTIPLKPGVDKRQREASINGLKSYLHI